MNEIPMGFDVDAVKRIKFQRNYCTIWRHLRCNNVRVLFSL